MLIALGGWFIVRAERRQFWLQRAGRMKSRMITSLFGAGTRMQHSSGQMRRQLQQSRSTIADVLAEHRFHIIIAGMILLAPVIATLAFKPHSILQGYDDRPHYRDPVVIALLQGEQLVPPPPLPPEIFVTREVEAIRQELAGASREWMVLDPDFRQRLLTVFQLMAQRGYQMALIEGYRSPERQAFLAGLGPHVTNAGAYQSFHQYGLAADCAFIRNGKLVISEKDSWAMEGYRLYGEMAQATGLVWGGGWKMMDFGHVELRKPNVRRKQ